MKHIDSHEATIEFVSTEHVQHVDTGRQRCSNSICQLCVNMVRGVTSELSFHQRSFTAEDGKSLGPDMIDVVVEAAPLGLNTRQDPQRTLERLAIVHWLDARRSMPW